MGRPRPLLAGCHDPHQAVASAPAKPSEPEVSIVTVAPRARAVVRELPGRIAPTRVADVRPRVSGIVVQRTFNQGSEVKAGDILYRIDPRPFEVELQSNEAALARANAVYDHAAQQRAPVALLTSQRATTDWWAEKEVATI